MPRLQYFQGPLWGGSPEMEMGDRRDPFDTLLILRGGNRRGSFNGCGVYVLSHGEMILVTAPPYPAR
jgi:hypothetical protein